MFDQTGDPKGAAGMLNAAARRPTRPDFRRCRLLGQIACLIGIYITSSSSAKSEEYHGYRQYQPNSISVERKKMIDAFPDMKSCSKFLDKHNSTAEMPLPILYLFPTIDVAEVCLFWLFEGLGSPEKAREWSRHYPLIERVEPEYIEKFLPSKFKGKNVVLQTFIYKNADNTLMFSVGLFGVLFKYIIYTQKIFLVWSDHGQIEQLNITSAIE